MPYYRDGGRVVTVGSNGGGPKAPDCVWNIFDLITSGRDSLTRYQERAATFGRRVPLVFLESLDGGPLTG